MKPYALYETDCYPDFAAMLHGVASKYGEATALTWYSRRGEPCSVSYQQLCRDAFRAAAVLHVLGLDGRHVALVGENSYEWLIGFFGIMLRGGVAVTIDIEQSVQTIHEMIAGADTQAMIVSPSMAEICRPLTQADGPVCKLLLTEPLTGATEPNLRELCAMVEDAAAEALAPLAVERDALSILVYTSGTTSTSKPVMLTQAGMLQNAGECVAMIQPCPKIFTALPLYHAYGLSCAVLANLINGVNVGLNGNLKTMLRDLQAFQPGSMMAVPLMVETLHKMLWTGIEKAGRKKAVSWLVGWVRRLDRLGLPVQSKKLRQIKRMGLGELSSIACGGAHLSREITEDLKAFGLLVLEGYGITECSPLIAVNRNQLYRFSSVGQVLPGFALTIREGEILVKGDAVMRGYYKRPEETAEAFDGEGWFKTGDLGYQDDKGFLYITGRKKNLIVLKNGKKISPEEIEEKLLRIPIIREVVAYGATSGASADDVKLAIMVYPDPAQTQHMTSYEILEHLQKEVDTLNQGLPAYKQIQMINIREEEFSKTSSRKIKRQTI